MIAPPIPKCYGTTRFRSDSLPAHRKEPTVNTIPEALEEPFMIPDQNEERLLRWIALFGQMSSRVSVHRATEPGFEEFIGLIEKRVREEKCIRDTEELVGWPTRTTTAFVVQVDSSPPGFVGVDVELSDTFFFSLSGQAFGATYFEWDGGEDDFMANTFSVSFCDEALSWDYVYSLIRNRVTEIENRVPEPPK